MSTPERNPRTLADRDVYDRYTLADTQWTESWGPELPVENPDGQKVQRNGITWSKGGQMKVENLPATVYQSTKSVSEIAASWLSNLVGKRVRITAPGHNTTNHTQTVAIQDGEHITLGYGRVDVHAYVIYPNGVRLGKSEADIVQRHRSKFAIADAHIKKQPRQLLRINPLGIEILTYFENANLSKDDPDRIMVYNQAGKVSVIRVDQPDVVEHTFGNTLELPWVRFANAAPPPASSSTEPSANTHAAQRSGTNAQAPSAGSRAESGSRSTHTTNTTTVGSQVSPAAGKNRTNLSNSQASTSAAGKEPARPSSFKAPGSTSRSATDSSSSQASIPAATKKATQPKQSATGSTSRNATESSSSQAPNPAATKTATQPKQSATGSTRGSQLPALTKPPPFAQAQPVKFGTEFFWVDKNNRKLAKYAPH